MGKSIGTVVNDASSANKRYFGNGQKGPRIFGGMIGVDARNPYSIGISTMPIPKKEPVGTLWEGRFSAPVIGGEYFSQAWEALVPALMLAAAVVVMGVLLLRAGGVAENADLPRLENNLVGAVRTIRFGEPPAEKTDRLAVVEPSSAIVGHNSAEPPAAAPAPENSARVNRQVARRANAQNSDPVCANGRIWTRRAGRRSWRCRR
jgi:hypothetical protein